MPWLCVDHMIQQGVWPMGLSYSDPLAIQNHWQNPDPLVKSRPTGKFQTHWLGHKVVHIVTPDIQKLKSCFHQYFIYIHKFNKTMTWKENHMVDRCMRTDYSRCDPSRITCGLGWYGWGHNSRSHSSHTCQPYGFLLWSFIGNNNCVVHHKTIKWCY